MSNFSNGVSRQPCDRCRVAKVYCDKIRLGCYRCRYLNLECKYEYVAKKRGKPKTKTLTPPINQNNQGLDIKTYTSLDFISYSDQRVQTNKSKREKVKVRYLYSKLQVKVDGSSFKLASHLFEHSVMDTHHKVFVSVNGKVDYFGVSPLALLLTMYVVHHSKPHHLPTNFSTAKPTDTSIPLRLPFTCPVGLVGFQLDSAMVDLAIESYFLYFHTQLPVLNRRDFVLKFASQPHLLQSIVVGIGLGYLPFISPSVKRHYCSLAKLELKKNYTNVRLTTVSALIIMSKFQHNLEDCRYGFFNLGLAMRMSYLLGLHIHSLNFDTETSQLRLRIFYTLHFVDKLYGFGMTLPFAYDFRLFHLPQPQFSTMDLLDWDDEPTQLAMLCIPNYLSLISQICQLLFLIKLKFDFIQRINQVEVFQLDHLAKVVANHLQVWELKLELAFNHLHGDVGWKVQIVDQYQLHLKLIYHSTLVQLYQPFTSLHQEPIATQAQLCTKFHSQTTLQVALQLDQRFLQFGTTYKFYTLTTAAFYLIKLLSKHEKDKHQDTSFNLDLIKNCLNLLDRCLPYYDLAKETKSMILLLAKSEGLDLNLN